MINLKSHLPPSILRTNRIFNRIVLSKIRKARLLITDDNYYKLLQASSSPHLFLSTIFEFSPYDNKKGNNRKWNQIRNKHIKGEQKKRNRVSPRNDTYI